VRCPWSICCHPRACCFTIMGASCRFWCGEEGIWFHYGDCGGAPWSGVLVGHVLNCILSALVWVCDVWPNVSVDQVGCIVENGQLSLGVQDTMGKIVVQMYCGHDGWYVVVASYGCIWWWSSILVFWINCRLVGRYAIGYDQGRQLSSYIFAEVFMVVWLCGCIACGEWTVAVRLKFLGKVVNGDS